MKKIAIALALSLAATSAFAGGANEPVYTVEPGVAVVPDDAPGVVIAGSFGLGTGGIILGALGLLLLAGLGGSDNTNSNVSSNTTTD